ncbi:hypothetical protein JRO89_XS08G0107400 [Xanthoceras sorbifolium]|uniref:Uncharacterized protein n=1 Tax=Xanthoceras sorbifolium TaxID=99658 RepID=A0ABQ8HP80_9ROSI|nr:hypothetical protein JRO89_XS08G0107400 [Xanthoceras sorbifolium]
MVVPLKTPEKEGQGAQDAKKAKLYSRMGKEVVSALFPVAALFFPFSPKNAGLDARLNKNSLFDVDNKKVAALNWMGMPQGCYCPKTGQSGYLTLA